MVDDKIVHLESLRQIYLTTFFTYLSYECDKGEVDEVEEKFIENYHKLHKNGV